MDTPFQAEKKKCKAAIGSKQRRGVVVATKKKKKKSSSHYFVDFVGNSIHETFEYLLQSR